MPDPDEGTTEFRAGSLRELLDEGEQASAPKAGGPKVNKNVLIGAGVGALVLVIVIVAVIAGSGGGGGGSKTEAGRSPFPVEVRTSLLTPAEIPNTRISICGADNAPLAMNVRIVSRKTAKELAGLSTTSLSVSATPDEQAKLASYRSRPKDMTVFPLDNCPPPPTATTVTSAPASTVPASAPPASTPPASG